MTTSNKANRRAVVTFVRAYGDANISDAIIRGVVSDEIKQIQAKRDYLEQKEHERLLRRMAEAKKKYTVLPPSRAQRIVEQILGIIALLFDDWSDPYKPVAKREPCKKRNEVCTSAGRQYS